MVLRIMFEYISTKKTSSIGLLFLIVVFLSVNNLTLAQFVPDLIYPHNNEVTKENNITFVWNKDVNQSLNYQFQLSIDASFSSLITDQTTTDNSFLVTSLSNYGQTHFWRVRSSQGAIFSNWSSVDSFLLFTPTSINGLAVWLDPNIGVVLNGPNVQSINDNTLNINNAAQVSVSQQPLFVSSDSLINNRSIIRFDGLDDFLEIADNSTIDFVDQFSTFVLVKPTIIASNKTIMAKWDYQTQGSWAFQTDFSLPNQLMFAPCLTITDPGNQKVFSTNANMQILTPALVHLVYNGGLAQKVKMYKNTLALTTSTVNVIPSVLPNSTATLKIGKYGGIATRYYQGDIGEILIYNTELTTSQRSLVDNYLRYKYAPPVSLGPDTLSDTTTFCLNVVLKAQSKYQTYLWSTGSSASSITAVLPGQYWVTVTDFLGNITSDTINVYSIEIPTPTITGICVNESIIWNADLGPGFTYLWSPNSETTPSISITTAGTYSVEVTDAFLCTKNSGNINFTLDTYSQTTFLGNDTSLCVDNLIDLQIGAPETISYLWPDASTGINYVVDTTGNYFVETINGNGCVAQDTIQITIAGQAPIADFSFQDQCLGLANVFTDLSVGLPTDPVSVWNWDLGDGNFNTTQNPSYTYGADGTYTVELYVESAGGCGAFHTEVVTINAIPTANFTKVGHCSGQTVQFTNTSTVGDAPLLSYLWNFDQPWLGAANISTFPAPFRTFDDAGTYNISLQVTDTNGCVDGIIIPLIIDLAPTVAFTASNACASAPIAFTNTSVAVLPATYLWDFGDFTSSIMPIPVKNFASIGLYTINLTVTASNGCFNTLQQQMTVHPNPVAAMSVGPICMGTYTSLTDNSTIATGSIGSSLWILNTNDSITGLSNVFVFNSLGQQEVILETTSDMGCTSTISQFIDITEALDASFTASTNIVAAEEPITFTNTTPTLSLVSWDFGDGNTLNFVSPTTYQYGTNYIDSIVTVSMFVTNVTGCLDTAYTSIDIRAASLDLALTNVFIQESNGFYTVGVQLKNEGSRTINKANLQILLPDGPVILEVWNGVLTPGESEIYIFSSQVNAYVAPTEDSPSFVCVEGLGFDVSNTAETYLENNKVCKNLVGENAVLLPIYPNPASNQVTIELLLTIDSDVSLELFDARGRLIKTIISTQTLDSGFYTYNVDISQIQAGTYFVRMRNGDVDVMNKLIISNY